MKQKRVILLFVLLAAIIWVGFTNFWIVPINNPCNTFVSEFSPDRTPALKQDGDEWELTISFTPSDDPEASRVYFATWLGERTFVISSTGRRFRATSHNGIFKIHVASEVESRKVLEDLCFKRGFD
jgi:hypothetical protein